MDNNIINREDDPTEQFDLRGSKIIYDGKEVSSEQLSLEIQNKIRELNSHALEKYLIIGSCVMIENSNNVIMIVGYNSNQDGKRYDYVGCEYPNGINNSQSILFNHNDIKKIYYFGYTTQAGNYYKSNIVNTEDTKNI